MDVIRFLEKVDLSGGSGSCWEWQGATGSDGYGRVRRDGKTFSAHRYSYQLFKGVLPEDLCVLHGCDNTRCVNPTHLFLGTKKDNMVDMRLKGRQGMPLPHLTAGQVDNIRLRVRRGESKAALALEFCVCRSTIQDITRGLTWKTAEDPRQGLLFAAESSVAGPAV
jgi:hypothetical protein